MGPTLRDVAARAGVSASAVSRTFSGGSVSAATRAKVEAAAGALGYSPNALASSLTTGRTKLIGLISTNFRNPLILEIFDLATRRLQDRGLRPLLVNLPEDGDPEAWVATMRAYSADAVIVASSTLAPSFARAFADAGLPVVHAFGRASAAPPVDVVGIDNVECGRMAARELLARGYGRLAFLGGPAAATSTQDRMAGFASAVAANGGAATHSFADAYTFDAGRREMARLLDAGAPADGYFCGDDVIAIGALSVLRERGFAVPDAVGVIGLNGMEMAGWASIDLTTIAQPIERIVDAAVARVAAMLDGTAGAVESRLFPCAVIERRTLRAVR